MTDPNLVSVAYCYVVNLLYPHPALPSIRLPPQWIFRLIHFTPTPPFSLPHRIIRLPGLPPSPSQHTAHTSPHHHGFLRSLEHCLSQIPIPRILPSLRLCLFSSDLPSLHSCHIPITSAPLCLPKPLLTWPSIEYLPPSVTTTGPVFIPAHKQGLPVLCYRSIRGN